MKKKIKEEDLGLALDEESIAFQILMFLSTVIVIFALATAIVYLV